MKVDEGDVLTFRSYSLSNTLYLFLSLYTISLYLTILTLSGQFCTQHCILSFLDFCEGWRETCPSKVRYLPILNLILPYPSESAPNTAYYPFGFLRRVAFQHCILPFRISAKAWRETRSSRAAIYLSDLY